jgi:hypothetical protein
VWGNLRCAGGRTGPHKGTPSTTGAKRRLIVLIAVRKSPVRAPAVMLKQRSNLQTAAEYRELIPGKDDGRFEGRWATSGSAEEMYHAARLTSSIWRSQRANWFQMTKLRLASSLGVQSGDMG